MNQLTGDESAAAPAAPISMTQRASMQDADPSATEVASLAAEIAAE